MINKLFILIIVLLIADNNHAQTIEINKLGKLKLDFSIIKKTPYIPAKNILAKVSVKDGESYVLTSPTNIQQLNYLFANGEMVNKGQPFAVLRGPEIHHFLSEINAYKTLLELSEQRMKNSRKLFEKKLIKEEKWLLINQNYYNAMLKYEHMMHFYDLIVSIDERTDSIIIKAPIAGLLKKKTIQNRISEGNVLATFVPEKSIRLKLQIPSNQVTNLEYIQLANCRLNIDTISQVSVNSFVNIWTESINKSCKLIFGQTQLSTPFYKKEAYQVLKAAVFSVKGKDYILVRKENRLESINVTLITATEYDYLLSSEIDLTGASVLITSVSAVQGVLIGLGGE